jgi:hypothetical protein
MGAGTGGADANGADCADAAIGNGGGSLRDGRIVALAHATTRLGLKSASLFQ